MSAKRAVLIIVMLVTVIAVPSFVSFVRLATALPAHPIAAADGIVVLTGGRDRIPDAVRLLMDNKGRRLLISGVNDRTSITDLVRIEPKLHDLMECCVDLGRKATNTVGNAIETAQWAREKGYQSLLIVTSHYHMPRALQQIHALAPTLTLTAYPVIPANLDIQHWWADPTTIRLLIGEWIKYHGARLRILLGLPGLGADPLSGNDERQDP